MCVCVLCYYVCIKTPTYCHRVCSVGAKGARRHRRYQTEQYLITQDTGKHTHSTLNRQITLDEGHSAEQSLRRELNEGINQTLLKL